MFMNEGFKNYVKNKEEEKTRNIQNNQNDLNSFSAPNQTKNYEVRQGTPVPLPQQQILQKKQTNSDQVKNSVNLPKPIVKNHGSGNNALFTAAIVIIIVVIILFLLYYFMRKNRK